MPPKAPVVKKRKEIDEVGGPPRIDISEWSNNWTRDTVLRGLFHALLVQRNKEDGKDNEELNPTGRKFFNTFGRATANKLPILNISEEDLDVLLRWMNSTDPPQLFDMPGLQLDGDTISTKAPLVLWDMTYTSILPVAKQVTQIGKERAKNFLDSTNKSDSLAKAWDAFKRVVNDDDAIWESILNDEEGAPRPSNVLERAVAYARPATVALLNRIIEDNPTQRKKEEKAFALSERQQGRGKSFSPSIIRIGRGSYEY